MQNEDHKVLGIQDLDADAKVDILQSLSLIDGLVDQMTPTALLDHKFRFVFANRSYAKATHKRVDELLGQYIFDVFPDKPERVKTILDKLKLAANGIASELLVLPFDLIGPDGEKTVHHWKTTQEPLRDGSGNLHWVLLKIHDVTSEVMAQRESEIAAQELDHRTKNVLSVIQAMTRLASREKVSKDEFAADLIGRIGAMSRNHSRLYANDFRGMTVEELLLEELSVIGTADSVTLNGPEVDINSRMARDLSMVIHELATNAAKFGSFSTDVGRLHVTWSEADEALKIEWQESHDGPVGNLSDKGFGSKLLRMLRDIDVTRSSGPGGLHAVLICSDYS